MEKDKLIFVRTSNENKEEIKKYAKTKCHTMSSLILYLLQRELKNNTL